MDNLGESRNAKNPYASGQPIQTESSSKLKRPFGTIILAVVLLLTGLWVGAQRCYQLASAFSSGEDVVIHPSYYVALTRDAISSASAILGAVGLLMGRSFGWWLSTFHAYWRLSIQSMLPLLGAIAAQSGTRAQSQAVSSALSAALIFLLIIAYLQKNNVASYFRVPAHRILLNVAFIVGCVCTGFALDVWWATTQN